MQIEIRALTFGGFYGGAWDQGQNEYDAAQLCEDLDIVQLKDEWGFGPDYRNEVAKIYAEEYVDMCNKILDVGFKFISQSVESPREYNFATDKIFIQVEVGDYTALVNKLIKLSDTPEYRTKLGEIIRENHTSCSGFWSWMSNDIEKWFTLMYDSDNEHYVSYFIAYLMEVMVPDMVENFDCNIFSYVSESTDLHCLRPETEEAKEEYELLQENREAYEAFVTGSGAGELDGYCPNHGAWEIYKEGYQDFLKEYNLEQKRKAQLAALPVIPGLIDDDE